MFIYSFTAENNVFYLFKLLLTCVCNVPFCTGTCVFVCGVCIVCGCAYGEKMTLWSLIPMYLSPCFMIS